MGKVWAVCPFFNELDVLEIRLGTLNCVVDHFVIGEATVTQTGQSKPLYFQDNIHRYRRWLHKIVPIVIDDMPMEPGEKGDWEREHFQRSALARGLDGVRPDDIILSTDVDEIPKPKYVSQEYVDVGRFYLDQFVYALNWRWKGASGARCLLLSGSRWEQKTLAEWHDSTRMWREHDVGWHLHCMGGVTSVRLKLLAMADNFFRQPELLHCFDTHHIERCIREGADLFDRAPNTEWVSIDQLPPYVQEHEETFAHMLVPNPSATSEALPCG